MRIEHLTLFRYRPFTFTGIEQLDLDCGSDVQNVIGTNGSGKSSLLRELNPLPAARPDYGEGGYKEIVLRHVNDTYILRSDFSLSSKPHAFIKNGGNDLNSSGTTAVQQELVAAHLGYTPQIHDILYGDECLSGMTVALRKTFLLTIHPCQMKLVLDHHRGVMTRLRAVRDQLSLLHERRTALSGQLLDPVQRHAMTTESTRLGDELSRLVEAIHKLEHHQTTLRETQNLLQTTASRVPTHRQITQRLSQLIAFRGVARDLPLAALVQTHTTALQTCEIQRSECIRRTKALIAEIDKYHQHLLTDDVQAMRETLRETIRALESDITRLQSQITETPFDASVMADLPQHLEWVGKAVDFFISHTAPIVSLRDVGALEAKLERYRHALHRSEGEDQRFEQTLNHIRERLQRRQIADIPDGCAQCVLFRDYHKNLSQIQSEYDTIRHEKHRTERRLGRLRMVLEGRSRALTLYLQSTPQLQRLSEYFQEHRFLLIPLRDLDLLATLRRNPSLLIVRLHGHYQRSQDTYLLRDKRQELERVLLNQTKLNQTDDIGRSFLTQLLTEKITELDVVRANHRTLDRLQDDGQKMIALLNSFDQMHHTLTAEYTALMVHEQREWLRGDLELCSNYLTYLAQCRRQTITRLAEIDRVLRDQDALMARYQDEILVSITHLTAQEQDYTALEKTLSPTIGLPHRYMVQFINDLFRTANTFLAEVFSYPFEFILLIEDDQVDYRFKLRVGEITIPDISRGSDAQKSMADLAFTLAILVNLHLTDYPLFLDEPDKPFDVHHKQSLLIFLKSIVEDGLVSQLFMINHNLVTYGGMHNADTLVLDPRNVLLPKVYNTHAEIVRY